MSFTLLILYIICTFLRPQEWVPVLLNKPLVNGLSIFAFVFLTIEQTSQKKIGFAKVPQNILILGLFFCVLMSHVSHMYFYGMIQAVKSFIIIYILFYLLLNGINTEFKFKTMIWLVVALICLLVFQGMYQVAHGYGWAGQGLTIQGGKITEAIIRINWVGIFSDPNDLSLTFVMAAGIVLAFFLGRTGFFAKIFSFLLLCILLYGIYLTNSRGGLLALMTTVYFFIVRRTGKFLIGGIIGGLLAFGILTFGPSRASLITIDESSAFSRVELWYEGILMLKSNPLFGVGFNMFTDSLPQTAHNSFVLAGAELGFIGLFFWMALIYSSFEGLSTIQKLKPEFYNYALGLQSSLIGFCAAAFFISRTYVILPYLFFAFSGALMNIVYEQDNSIVFKFTKKDARNVFWLCIGSILLTYMVIKVGL